MKAPKRKRPLPRTVSQTIPDGVNLQELARRVTYVGSPEHKTYPSSSGPPRLRADASKCDASFRDRVSEIQDCLREAVQARKVGDPWENDRFPRYVWGRLDGLCYEARLVNSACGEYKGYPLSAEEVPKGL